MSDLALVLRSYFGIFIVLVLAFSFFLFFVLISHCRHYSCSSIFFVLIHVFSLFLLFGLIFTLSSLFLFFHFLCKNKENARTRILAFSMFLFLYFRCSYSEKRKGDPWLNTNGFKECKVTNEERFVAWFQYSPL